MLLFCVQRMPHQAQDINGRLTIKGAQVADSGEYACAAIGAPQVQRVVARLSVETRKYSSTPDSPTGNMEYCIDDHL